MDATSQLETEQKDDAGPDFELPDLSGLPGYPVTGPETFHMTAVYFDTDDQRLIANKVTLRRRTGGEDDAWHLKPPLPPGPPPRAAPAAQRGHRHRPRPDAGDGGRVHRWPAAAADRPAEHRPDHPPPDQPGPAGPRRGGRGSRQRP